MTEQKKLYYKAQLKNFLEKDLEIDTSKPFLCLNPMHPDEHPSMSFDKNRDKVHCFACGVDWDIFDLVGALYGIEDTKERFERVENIIKGTPQGYKEIEYLKAKVHQKEAEGERTPKEEKPKEILMAYYNKCNANLENTDYLERRGISRETANRFLIGYDPYFKGREGKNWEAVIIPTTQFTYTARNTDMTADSKDRVKKHGEANIFNYIAIKRAVKPIFIVEGEFDALSFEEVGANAIALGGASNIRKLIEYIRTEKKDFNNYFILALDNDAAGREATEKLKKELDNIEIESYISQDIYGECKDANELLIKDKQTFIENIQKAYSIKEQLKENELKIYKSLSNKGFLQNFINGIKEGASTEYISTGFENLDKALDGGFYEGLYFCGAISSLGKTTLMTQIGDQIAQGGNDVLIFSLEMSRNELIAKSISRETVKYCLKNQVPINYAKTTRGITTTSRWANYSPEEKQTIFESMRNYEAFSENIYIFEGVGNIGVEEIRETVKKHIDITGKKPVVIIDYIQILAPLDIRVSDKQNMDKTVLELKRISRDLKITIIGISSLNRGNYNNKINMEAFKESGAIEYGSDVLIGLQFKGAGENIFNINEAKKKNPREIELVILKNRNGNTGEIINFEFYPLFNYFRKA